MKNETRKITDGAMLVAIMGAILLLDRQLAGLIEGTFLFLYPLPMVMFSSKYGLKDSWIVLFAIAVIGFVTTIPSSAIIAIFYSLIGLVYGSGVYAKLSQKKLLIRTVSLAILVNVITVVVFSSFFGYDITSEIAMLKDMFSQLEQQVGISLAAGVDINQLLTTAMIMSVMLSGVLNAVVLHMVSLLIFKRMHIEVKKGLPFIYYYPPKWCGYLALVGMVAFQYAVHQPFEQAAFNIALQAIGMCGLLYLLVFGVVALMLTIRVYFPTMKWMGVLLVVMLVFGFSLAVEILGFLYIATNFHARLLDQGVRR